MHTFDVMTWAGGTFIDHSVQVKIFSSFVMWWANEMPINILTPSLLHLGQEVRKHVSRCICPDDYDGHGNQMFGVLKSQHFSYSWLFTTTNSISGDFCPILDDLWRPVVVKSKSVAQRLLQWPHLWPFSLCLLWYGSISSFGRWARSKEKSQKIENYSKTLQPIICTCSLCLLTEDPCHCCTSSIRLFLPQCISE